MTCRPRQLEAADAIVNQALDIICYFYPDMWFLENPKTGLLKDRGLLDNITYIDVDYCQFSDWGYKKPTRIWGPTNLKFLQHRLCDGVTCPNLYTRPNGNIGHKRVLGATPPEGLPRVPLEDQCRIPEGVIEYIMGWDKGKGKVHASLGKAPAAQGRAPAAPGSAKPLHYDFRPPLGPPPPLSNPARRPP
jgi:hypothetical protein